MAIGDCKNAPCASPLDFDSMLVSLFATADSTGCIGLKTYGELASCATLTSAAECASDMTLQQVIERSIVDDGNGGSALRVWLMVDAVTCSHDCAHYDDFEAVLKGLFSSDGNCFGLRLYLSALTCSDIESFASCAAEMTVEQIIKASLWVDACGDDALAVIIPTFETCVATDCGLELTWAQLISLLFAKSDSADCGVMKLNYNTGVETYTDVIECGTFRTVEQVFREAVTSATCGLMLNVYSLNRAGRNPD